MTVDWNARLGSILGPVWRKGTGEGVIDTAYTAVCNEIDRTHVLSDTAQRAIREAIEELATRNEGANTGTTITKIVEAGLIPRENVNKGGKPDGSCS